MRLFVALELPEAIRLACERLQQGVPAARWIPAENMHLTLRFIGEVDGAAFEDLIESLADVVVEPFEIEVASVGHFETRQMPTVLWAGIRPNPDLKRLQAKVERAVRAAGLPPETRKFAPHVTLARLGDTDPVRVRNFLQRNALFQPGSVPVGGFTLFSSHLGKGDPHYRAEVEYHFTEPIY
jgi:2'-5' RNA ligase